MAETVVEIEEWLRDDWYKKQIKSRNEGTSDGKNFKLLARQKEWNFFKEDSYDLIVAGERELQIKFTAVEDCPREEGM